MNQAEAAKLIALGLMNWQYKAAELGKEQSQQLAKMWAYAMPDIPYNVGEASLMKLVRTSKFFPQVAEIIEAAESLMRRPEDPPPAEDAWAEVIRQLDPYKAPVYSHELIKKAVKCMGYMQIVNSENPAIDRAQFMKIYNNLLQRHRVDQENIVVIKLTGGKITLLGQGGPG